MTAPAFNVGAFVQGAPTSPRVPVWHADLLTAYADGVMAEKGEEREAYLAHFVFGADRQAHYAANRNSVAGFVGACWCRLLVLDIDRADLANALADARRLVAFLHQRYPEAEGDVPVTSPGERGFTFSSNSPTTHCRQWGFTASPERSPKRSPPAPALRSTLRCMTSPTSSGCRTPGTRALGCTSGALTRTRCSGSTSTASANTPGTRRAMASQPCGCVPRT